MVMRISIGYLLTLWLLPSVIAMASDLQTESNSVAFDGIVVCLSIEGSFCGILGDDGRRYEPTNLPEAFCRPGLRVKARVRPLKSTASARMWGEPIEIVEISTAPEHSRH